MKKSFFCFSLALSTLVFNAAWAENELPAVLENFKNTPFYKTIEKQAFGEAKKHLLKNKTEFIDGLFEIYVVLYDFGKPGRIKYVYDKEFNLICG